MTHTGLNGRGIRSDIAQVVKAHGWARIAGDCFEEAFPEPDTRSLEAGLKAIALALGGHRPAAPEPSQEQQIEAFCKEHGFLYSRRCREDFGEDHRFDLTDEAKARVKLAADVADRMQQARVEVLALYGTSWPDRARPYIAEIRRRMKSTGQPALDAALDIAKALSAAGHSPMILLAAAVELIEDEQRNGSKPG